MASYSAWPTVGTGDPWTASQHNTYGRDNNTYFKDETDDHNNRARSEVASALTIDTGAITVFGTAGQGTYQIEGEGGSNDTLVTINGGSSGDIIVLTKGGEEILLDDGAGNIDCGEYGDILLENAGDNVVLLYVLSSWIVLSTNVITGLRKLREVGFESIIDNGNSGASKTIDWTAGNKQKVTLTGDCTFTFTPPIGIGNLTLELLGDATARSLTWPATVKWVGTGEPVWSGGSGDKNIAVFFYDGVDYVACGAIPV